MRVCVFEPARAALTPAAGGGDCGETHPLNSPLYREWIVPPFFESKVGNTFIVACVSPSRFTT